MTDEKKIVIYTTPWCGDCTRSKTWFDSHNVLYTEIDIEKNDQAEAYVLEVTGGYPSVPTILFPDGSILIEPGNDELEKKVKELGIQ